MGSTGSRPWRSMSEGEPPADGLAGGTSPIDAAAIERLRELDPDGRQGMLERVLKAYQLTLERHLAEIRSASAAADAETLMRAAHTLKSSSAAIGAPGLAGRCAAVELHIRNGRGLPAHGEVAELIHEGHSVASAVGAMLAARGRQVR